jgi:hypothetical protein
VATSVTINAALFASVAVDDVVEANDLGDAVRPCQRRRASPRARPQVAARDVPRGVTAGAARLGEDPATKCDHLQRLAARGRAHQHRANRRFCLTFSAPQKNLFGLSIRPSLLRRSYEPPTATSARRNTTMRIMTVVNATKNREASLEQEETT